MAAEPRDALAQLRREREQGVLALRCDDWGFELLVAFGSSVDHDWPRPPRDLDLAVVLGGGTSLLSALDALVAHLGLEKIDLLDLGRAGEAARAQALGRGELLYERMPGMFAEMQVFAVVKHADTKWLRDLELEALAQ